ncbi:hypothetical protein ACFXI0_25225 [Kitasatospora indigofera]|uniref:hypothetical protein n=1 Tax=Kitasatospora indigofera TaxID=67307 RepID=UPI0036BAE60F
MGAEPVEDPGVGELADTTRALAGEYRASTRGRAVRQAGDLLDAAVGELRSADRFRGALLPQVNRHLRHARTLLLQARRHLVWAQCPLTTQPTGPSRTEI